MASAYSTFGSFLRPRRSSLRETVEIPTAHGKGHLVRMGVLFGAVALQLFFYLATLFPTQNVLPGDWTTLGPGFLLDLVYSTLAIGMIAALPLIRPDKARALQIEPGGLAGFGIRYMIFGLGWTLALLALGTLASGAPTPVLDGVERLQGLVTTCVFVSVSEELLFRCAMTEVFGGAVSTLAFVGYHLFAYSVSFGFGWGLAWALAKAGIYGAIFLAEYKLFALSAAMASHAAVDLVAGGIITFPHGAAWSLL